MKQNVHRIGKMAFEDFGRTVIVIPDYEYSVNIILLEQLISGKYRILTIDEYLSDDGNSTEYYVQTNIPWSDYSSTPDPDMKYINRDKLN